MNHPSDSVMGETIAAVAASGGAIGIVRVSGSLVPHIAAGILGRIPPARRALYAPFMDAEGVVLDEGIALYFPAPHSFTGEWVLELQGHGSPAVLGAILSACFSLGARPARPGEFSQRAFLNDKIDLAQAEAIADLITSRSKDAAQAAMRSLHGVFSDHVHALVESLTLWRAHIEAWIDFSEDMESEDFNEKEIILAPLQRIQQDISNLLVQVQRGVRLRNRLPVAILGPPNAGKSTLMNRLAAREVSIVSAIPGTTRDVIKEEVMLDGVVLQVADTAGLHGAGDDIEKEGQRRALDHGETADLILWVEDDAEPMRVSEHKARILALPEVLIVRNKIDITGRAPGVWDDDGRKTITLSACTGEGMEYLENELLSRSGKVSTEGDFTARSRHVDALIKAEEGLMRVGAIWRNNRELELMAEELLAVQHILGEITGAVSNEELLDRIFSEFCIGK